MKLFVLFVLLLGYCASCIVVMCWHDVRTYMYAGASASVSARAEERENACAPVISSCASYMHTDNEMTHSLGGFARVPQRHVLCTSLRRRCCKCCCCCCCSILNSSSMSSLSSGRALGKRGSLWNHAAVGTTLLVLVLVLLIDGNSASGACTPAPRCCGIEGSGSALRCGGHACVLAAAPAVGVDVYGSRALVSDDMAAVLNDGSAP